MTIDVEVKALVDGAGTALTATYRHGWVPDDAEFPYASFLDPIGDAIALSGDGRTLGRRRLLQVDVWQDEASEVDGMIEVLVDALDGQKVASGFRLRVQDVSQVPGPEDEEDIVHHVLTLSVARIA